MSDETPARLHAEVLAVVFDDRDHAIALAAKAREFARLSGDRLSAAWADRIDGHLAHTGGDYAGAADAYQRAVAGFEVEGAAIEVGRTLLSGLQALIYRGEYDRAHRWAARAEAIFRENGDALRLARLASNAGNIYYRQDRLEQAKACYLRAIEGFAANGQPRDLAAALSNLAVCSISLGEFSAAMGYYERARDHCREHGLDNLAARADYNVAYLHYLRGDYREAFELYRRARELARRTGDRYHEALCDLDEAEMSLDLNLTGEGLRLAKRARDGFVALGMRYERAKALVNIAVANSQYQAFDDAEKALRAARRLFVAEKNALWPAMVDQLRAVAAFRSSRVSRARRLASSAWRTLLEAPFPGRAAHAQILLARVWLAGGDWERAIAESRDAMGYAGNAASPSLRFHADLLRGEIAELRGLWLEACDSYEAARANIEELRNRLHSEDLRISILSDKLAVYTSLAALCMESPASAEIGGVERALALVQEAKSRTLAERIAGAEACSEPEAARDLRGELNWIYRQVELNSALDLLTGANRAATLRTRAAEIERRLRGLSEPAAQPGKAAALSLSGVLEPHERFVELVEIRGRFHAFVLSPAGVSAVPLGPVATVLAVLRLVRFQIGKYRWAGRFDLLRRDTMGAVQSHLFDLHRMLIAPLDPHLDGCTTLLIAPCHGLHELPFGALHDGSQALIDRFAVSIAPSATVFALGRTRPRTAASGSLVMAVPDSANPGIEHEARLVHEALWDSELLLGKDASLEAFTERAPGRRIVHIASHGIHRGDNPFFSGVELAGARLSLFDLQQLSLNVDLVTLSACHSGAGVSIGGDERIGVLRGFLLAGVRSVLASLWEVDDESALAFMRVFYQEVGAGADWASAARRAAIERRAVQAHPYYWAPFLVFGDPGAPGGTQGERSGKYFRCR
ncbi:MAG: CHAT domain-containing protein [Bryobacteraceae bacterium]